MRKWHILLNIHGLASLASLARHYNLVSQSRETWKMRDFANPIVNIVLLSRLESFFCQSQTLNLWDVIVNKCLKGFLSSNGSWYCRDFITNSVSVSWLPSIRTSCSNRHFPSCQKLSQGKTVWNFSHPEIWNQKIMSIYRKTELNFL